ncbi:hypothetical protein D9M70_374700 [compost metagenome]
MIERKTFLHQAEINRTGVLGVLLVISMVEDGVETQGEFHRTTIPVEMDPVQQMGFVNSDLANRMPPLPPVSDEDIQRVVQAHQLLVAQYGSGQ